MSGVDYADGSEDRVLKVLRGARDVSAGSAELAGAIDSPEAAYHLSPARGGVLAPLVLRAGARAVDLGCGSGVLTRVLGEAGLDVLGIEGVPERADAARERCRDLDRVTIVDQPLRAGLADGERFDLALMCGVLEYAGRYDTGPEALLEAAASSLDDGGVLVVAIENQLGLGYLLGGTEDHHGTAWVGVNDYPAGQASPRTWGRKALSALLAGAGLTAQRWLFPYPDYKVPRIILDESAFDRPDAVDLVDKLVRDPLLGSFHGNDAAAHGRTAHRLAVAEGMGTAVAPSFLVVAARSADALAAHVSPGVAWLTGGPRRPQWRRTRVVTADATLRLVSRPEAVAHPWLRQELADVESIVPGRGLDAHLLDALAGGDLDQLAALLQVWRSACAGTARPLAETDLRHPYLPGRHGIDVLAADCLDVHPGNVILRHDGGVERIDREWLAGGGVDAELVLLRALLEFSREVVTGHAPTPWPEANTVKDVFTELCAAAGLADALRTRWAELVRAEARLQEAVGARPADAAADEIEADAVARRPEQAWSIVGGLATLLDDRARLADVEAELRTVGEHVAEQTAHIAAVEGELARAGEYSAGLITELDAAKAAVAEAGAALKSATAAAESASASAAEARETVSALTDDLRVAQADVAAAHAEIALKDDRLGVAFAELTSAVAEGSRLQAEVDAASQVAAQLDRARTELAALENSRVTRLARKTLWPAGRAVRGVRDLALGRPGDEPDSVLRTLGRHAPTLSALAARRTRDAARPIRESRLTFHVTLPAAQLGSGRLSIDFEGWVAHEQLPVRSVALVAHTGEFPARLSPPSQALLDLLAARRIHPANGQMINVRVPVVDQAAAVRLRIVLVDGTVIDRPLPNLPTLAS